MQETRAKTKKRLPYFFRLFRHVPSFTKKKKMFRSGRDAIKLTLLSFRDSERRSNLKDKAEVFIITTGLVVRIYA